MKILWTPRAVEDLEVAVTYISVDKPDAAIRVANKIYTDVKALVTMPHMGRMGELPGTREIVFHPWPYIAVYKVSLDEIRIIRIRHAAQDWP